MAVLTTMPIVPLPEPKFAVGQMVRITGTFSQLAAYGVGGYATFNHGGAELKAILASGRGRVLRVFECGGPTPTWGYDVLVEALEYRSSVWSYREEHLALYRPEPPETEYL